MWVHIGRSRFVLHAVFLLSLVLGSTVQKDLSFNDLFSVCVLVSDRQREVHRLGFYVSYKYRGDI